jgi:hypothetical protein
MEERPVRRRLPGWTIAVLTIAGAGLGALLGGAIAIEGHGIPYGGCSGLYPATCEYAFQTGVVVGGLAGLSIAGALVWPASGRRRVAMLSSGAGAIVAIPIATYLVASTDPANHETDMARMAIWVGGIALAAALTAWIVAAWVGRTR